MTVIQLVKALQALPNQDAVVIYDAGPTLINTCCGIVDAHGAPLRRAHFPIEGTSRPAHGQEAGRVVYLCDAD